MSNSGDPPLPGVKELSPTNPTPPESKNPVLEDGLVTTTVAAADVENLSEQDPDLAADVFEQEVDYSMSNNDEEDNTFVFDPEVQLAKAAQRLAEEDMWLAHRSMLSPGAVSPAESQNTTNSTMRAPRQTFHQRSTPYNTPTTRRNLTANKILDRVERQVKPTALTGAWLETMAAFVHANGAHSQNGMSSTTPTTVDEAEGVADANTPEPTMVTDAQPTVQSAATSDPQSGLMPTKPQQNTQHGGMPMMFTAATRASVRPANNLPASLMISGAYATCAMPIIPRTSGAPRAQGAMPGDAGRAHDPAAKPAGQAHPAQRQGHAVDWEGYRRNSNRVAGANFCAKRIPMTINGLQSGPWDEWTFPDGESIDNKLMDFEVVYQATKTFVPVTIEPAISQAISQRWQMAARVPGTPVYGQPVPFTTITRVIKKDKTYYRIAFPDNVTALVFLRHVQAFMFNFEGKTYKFVYHSRAYLFSHALLKIDVFPARILGGVPQNRFTDEVYTACITKLVEQICTLPFVEGLVGVWRNFNVDIMSGQMTGGNRAVLLINKTQQFSEVILPGFFNEQGDHFPPTTGYGQHCWFQLTYHGRDTFCKTCFQVVDSHGMKGCPLVVCRGCGHLGHLVDNCPTSQNSSRGGRGGCGGRGGHYWMHESEW